MQVLAHRGAPRQGVADNTVEAVLAALRDGADGVELDLRLCADGVLVAAHDPVVRLAGAALLPVVSTRWSTLRERAQRAGHPLARLEQLAAVAGAARLVLELKSPPAGSRDRTVRGLVAALRQLRREDLAPDVTVSSFDAELLSALRCEPTVGPRLRTALLGEAHHPLLGLVRRALADGHDEVHPQLTALTGSAAVAAAHAVGLAVVPWTVNSRRGLARAARLGVDAVITDEPARARRARQTGRPSRASA